MNDFIQVPSKGQPMTAQWGADVANGLNAIRSAGQSGMLLTEGPTGTGFAPLPANLRDRRAASPLHPWKVFAVGKSEDVDHFFEIYIPEIAVTVNGKPIEEIEGATKLNPPPGQEEDAKPDRYTIDQEDDIRDGFSTLTLVIIRDKAEDGGGSAPDDDLEYKAVLAFDLEDYLDDKRVKALVPIASLDIAAGNDFDRGKVASQLQKEVIRIERLEVPADRLSIDRITDPDAAEPETIQIKDFDNDDSNGGQGLAERLYVEKQGEGESATYKVKSDDKDVYLIARVNGKIKYIPISGEEGKDPDEENPQPEDPCGHPGDDDNEGGVNDGEKPDHPGIGGKDKIDGGVRGDGGVHPGDDDCTRNC